MPLQSFRVQYLPPNAAHAERNCGTARPGDDRPDLDRFVDRPEESASADVTLISRGVTVTAHVEVSDTYLVVVRPTGGGARVGQRRIGSGDAVELYWVGGQEERTLAGTVTQLEDGEPTRGGTSRSPAGRAQPAAQGGAGPGPGPRDHPVGRGAR